ncbi:MAG: AraC family transcriptional regulator [Mojavia pulchra JT2-VF2]|jgi:AraC-like DNA-binding protein|uniref:AraC family transcriptional regulator n=1 Tax=Mojavia pulchra JT2-VF2 TaxID=287848 RepID=A0A951Q3G4_9NOST|nr:AraC family transcriptional regulator [Mojavia pulchra JT2-VF2]
MKKTTELAQFWRVESLQNLEFMRATYVNHTFPRHSHETFGIGIVEQGSVKTVQRGTTYTIPAGSIVLFNPDEVHACGAADEVGWTYRMLYPENSLLQQVMAEIMNREQTPFFPFAAVQDYDLARRLWQLHTASTETGSNLMQASCLLSTLTQLLTRYTRECPELPIVGLETRAVTQAKDYLEAHYHENVSLEQLAAIANLQPLRLLRAFRKQLGLPPHKYLTQIRITRAKHDLAQGIPISTVAIATGFADQSHLTRHFKRLVGTTPRQYALGCKNVQDNACRNELL